MNDSHDPLSEPCFLVGAERSGTTLLRLMLDGHPHIAMCSEMEFIVTHLPETGWPDTAEYIDALQTSRVFRDTGFTADPALTYPELMNSFLRQKLDRSGPGSRIVGGTVHYLFDRLLRIWPRARFIHLLRDGRDVARSCVAMGWAGNAWAGVELWIHAERLWARMKESLPAGRYIELSYEDLVRDHVPTLTRVCRFLGLDYHPAMMDYTRESTYEAPDPKLIAQWKRKMSPDDIRQVEARIAPMLVERGYELSGLPALDITPALERKLRRRDRLGKIRFGLKRYGAINMGASYLSHRLRLKALQRRVAISRVSIDTAHIK